MMMNLILHNCPSRESSPSTLPREPPMMTSMMMRRTVNPTIFWIVWSRRRTTLFNKLQETKILRTISPTSQHSTSCNNKVRNNFSTCFHLFHHCNFILSVVIIHLKFVIISGSGSGQMSSTQNDKGKYCVLVIQRVMYLNKDSKVQFCPQKAGNSKVFDKIPVLDIIIVCTITTFILELVMSSSCSSVGSSGSILMSSPVFVDSAPNYRWVQQHDSDRDCSSK